MKRLIALLLLLSAPAWAQSTANPVTPGTLTTIGCQGGAASCFVPLGSTNPLPIGVYDGSNNAGYVLTSNGSATVATFQPGGGGGSGSPGGSTNAVQYNAGSGNFGGVSLSSGQLVIGQSGAPAAETISGACTLSSTGVLTCGGITLGTSTSATNPQRSGQAGTGFFSATSNVVSIAANGSDVVDIGTTGVNVTGQVTASGGYVVGGTNSVTLSGNGVIEYLTPNMRFSLPSTESYYFYNQGRGTNLLMELNGSTGAVNIPELTASELVATDSSKNLASVTALPSNTTATTQTVGDNTTKVATDAFVIANAGSGGTITLGTSAASTNPQRSSEAGTGFYSDTDKVVEVAANGIEAMAFNTVASGVDYLSVTPAATANPASVQLNATGSDTNVNLSLMSKGAAGGVTIGTTGLPSNVYLEINPDTASSVFTGVQIKSAQSFAASFNITSTASGGKGWSFFANNTGTGVGPAGGFIFQDTTDNFYSWGINQGGSTFVLSGGVYGWTNQSQFLGSSNDTGISRDSAGVVDVGTGAQGSKAGTLQDAAEVVSGLGTFGTVDIGSTAAATAGTVADMSHATNSMLLPTGTTAQRPTGVAGMLRYNSDTPGIEAFYSSAWNTLGSGGGGGTITLGTSAAATNPQRSSEATTGLYSLNSGEIDLGVVTTGIIDKWTSAGEAVTGALKVSTTVAIGTTTQTAGTSLDLGSTTNTVLLPVGNTAARPTGVNGMVRYNSQANTYQTVEAYMNSIWTVLQPLVGGGLDPAASGSTNATALQGQITAMQTRGATTLASAYGVNGILIPQGVYPVTTMLNEQPWIKLQTAGNVEINASGASAISVSTNNTTASGNATLHFASVPATIRVGMNIVDTTTGAAIPTGAQVLSTTGTTVVMTVNAAGPGVGSGNSIAFSYITMDVNNDVVPTNDFNNWYNTSNEAPFIDAMGGTMLFNGPGQSSNSIGMIMGSNSASPGTENNVREVQVSGLSIMNYGTCLRLINYSLYMIHFNRGGEIANCGHGVDTMTMAATVNSGEGNLFSGGWVIGDNTVGYYQDAPGVEMTFEGAHFDFNTTADFQDTANAGFSFVNCQDCHIEDVSPNIMVDGPVANNNNIWSKHSFHGGSFTEDIPRALFTGQIVLDIDGVQFAGYSSSSNAPTALFMAAPAVTATRMSHITWEATPQLTAFSLLANDDPCVSQGVNAANLATAPPPTYALSTINGATTGVTVTVSNSPAWTGGACATSLGIKFTESNTTNNATVVTDKFPVKPGDQVVEDLVFQTNQASATGNLQTGMIWIPCNASVATSSTGVFSSVNIGAQVGANAFAKMTTVNNNYVPSGICYAQMEFNISGMKASEVDTVVFAGASIE